MIHNIAQILFAMFAIGNCSCVSAFMSLNKSNRKHISLNTSTFDFGRIFNNFNKDTAEDDSDSVKAQFLESLENLDKLNQASKDRTALVSKMINEKVLTSNLRANLKKNGMDYSLAKPGSKQSFEQVAAGTWKVIYAPHMTTISGLFGGNFDVQYILDRSGKITSHARYDFPIIGQGFLSVSGTYSSEDDDSVSRVDFDKAWVKLDNMPYDTLENVPESFMKNIINQIGKTVFIDSFAVFPVSFLDNDLIVFDFELLGTRIAARKI